MFKKLYFLFFFVIFLCGDQLNGLASSAFQETQSEPPSEKDSVIEKNEDIIFDDPSIFGIPEPIIDESAAVDVGTKKELTDEELAARLSEIKERMEKAEALEKEASTQEEAIEAYRDLIREFPEHAIGAYVELGELLAQLGDLRKAQVLFQSAIDLDPSCAKAYLMMGKIYWAKREIGTARFYWETSIELDPTDPDAFHCLGKALHRRKFYPQAVQAFKKALALNDSLATVHFDLGISYGKMERHEESHRCFERSKELAPNQNPFALGQVYQSLGRFHNARDEYETGLSKFPEYGEGWQLYGQALELLSLDNNATEAYEKSIELWPEYPDAYFRLAGLLSGNGLHSLVLMNVSLNSCGLNHERVISLYQKVLELKPDVKFAREALAFCEAELIEVSKWDERIKLAWANEMPIDEFQKPVQKASMGLFEWLFEMLTNFFVQWKEYFLNPKWPDNVGGFNKVKRVHVQSSKDFRKYIDAHKPVVIQNFQGKFAQSEEWSIDSLRAKFGNSTVRVSVSETDRYSAPESGSLWQVFDQEVLARPAKTSMKFGHFLDLLALKNISETFYLEYLELNRYLGKEVLAMVPEPKHALESGMKHLVTNFWMGYRPTTSPLHYDNYENLLCQIKGKKELILFQPQDIEHLHYAERRVAIIEYTFPGNFSRNYTNVSTSRDTIFASSVRLNNPDTTKFPGFLKAKPFKVVLNPGDVLYIPAHWHHEVKSIPDENSVNVAVSFWYKNETYFAEEKSFLQANDPFYAFRHSEL